MSDVGTMRAILKTLSLILLAGSSCELALADGGTVRLVEDVGGYQISVFTSPNPLRAGPVDVSVLVQDTATAEPVPNTQIFLRLTPRDRLTATMHALATPAAATNKLLQAALVELPSPGTWDVEVECTTDNSRQTVRFTMEAGTPLPRWLTVWPWFTWPFAAVLLFGVHRALVASQKVPR